ncbi:MAG TPA: two-component regulator propeller domain-containing protein [Bacteroidales bacterium]|nr:two-component regulator propeller domain-containing protein [Bacteroidales bacterium]HPT22145.1 two-component regulator propeller domain-containing protein [Bacteroidales bacterium]
MKKSINFLIATLIVFSFESMSQYAAVASGQKVPVTNRSFNGAFSAKNFHSALVDENNTKWFLTESGIVSFDGKKWKAYDKNKNIPSQNLKSFSAKGQNVLIATPNGVTVTTLPIKPKTPATTINTKNGSLLSDNVVSVATGKNDIQWFGTDKGISACINNKWLEVGYEDMYPGFMFEEFKITSMATNRTGDSLYVATEGAGIARIYKNEVDGISGASVYAQWGPIILPSDKVYSVLIAPDGTKWFGTELGVARHTGNNTLENWTVFSTADGLVNDFVQAIGIDKKGTLWFGTKGGLSAFDGTKWTSYTIKDGLNSNNILCVVVDKNDVVWLGTDNGAMSFSNGAFVSYK